MAIKLDNTINTILIIVLFLIGCNNSQSNAGHNDELLIDTPMAVIDSSETFLEDYFEDKFDTTILDILKIRDGSSFSNFMSNHSNELKEDLRPFPVHVFVNQNETEYLLTYFYYGDSKNVFSAFEIGLLSDDSGVTKDFVNTDYPKFQTESGISLGLSYEEVILVKGDKYIVTKSNEGMLVVSYSFDNYAKSTFLQRYNMPSYFMTYSFTDSILDNIYFGFDYP